MTVDDLKLRALAESHDRKQSMSVSVATVLHLLNELDQSRFTIEYGKRMHKQTVQERDSLMAEREKLLGVLKDARRVIASEIFKSAPFASYSQAWSDMHDSVKACSHIKTELES